jgi:hypothetical protein
VGTLVGWGLAFAMVGIIVDAPPAGRRGEGRPASLQRDGRP